MSQIDESFDTLLKSLKSVLPDHGSYDLRRFDRAIILETPADVAAFSVFNMHVQEKFDAAYDEFKALYREHHTDWDKRTLSFVLCRTSRKSEDDRFYAEREHDPLFCRKYVIHAHEDIGQQSQELLRLPFLPFPDDKTLNLIRPKSAQDLLQAAGVPASLTRKLVEPGQRAAEGIVNDLIGGKEYFPDVLRQPLEAGVTQVKPRTITRLKQVTVESFRAYQKSQEFDLDASVVVLYGPNGLGKTSFFDAVDYACTGRIGRLCRQRKFNQEDFSRVATYLDDTAGTGNVVLHGTSGQTDSPQTDWSLRRGTGNWSTAWINEEKTDRTDAISFLTKAEWGEVRPRLQNVESLFRATHLFGQDEQELLAEFRKSSMLQENFVSEMLALQDYSHGLAKANDVCQLLETKKSSLQAELASLEDEKNFLTESFSPADDARDSHTQETIHQLAADIGKRVNASRLEARFPDEQVTPDEIANWIDLASAQANSTEHRAQEARAARNDLPVLLQTKEHIASSQKKLASLDAELRSIADEKALLQDQLAEAADHITARNSAQIEFDRRRRELEAVKKWTATRTEHEQQLERYRSENSDVAKDIVAAEAVLSKFESELKSTISDRDKKNQSVATLQSMLDSVSRMIESLPGYVAAEKDRKHMTERLQELSKQRQQLAERTAQLREKALTAKAERTKLTPEYERAKSQQAELDMLLDTIQSHLAGADCPLCGTDFSSHESLLKRINQHRKQQSTKSTITSQFVLLKAAEAEAQDQLSKANAEVNALARTDVELKSRLESIDACTANFLATAKALFKEEVTDVDEAALVAHRKSIQSDLRVLHKDIQQTGNRISELNEQCDTTSDQISKLLERAEYLTTTINSRDEELMREDARARDVLAAEQITDSEVENLIGQIQEAMSQSLQLHEELRRTVEQLGISVKSVETRLAEATKRREALNLELEKAQSIEARISRRLSDLQLTDDAVKADKVIADLESEATLLRQVITDARVLQTALTGMLSRLRNEQVKEQIEALDSKVTQIKQYEASVVSHLSCCKSIVSLLRSERQSSVENHIAAYGPLISNIQQRLRSVYGFGGVHLEARGGEVAAQVEWRDRDVYLRPTDFFSDSQKQILMLSVFLAGCLRQNWSGFAPVLLDDPVTHFDDLNAYGFVELIRGIISPKPNEWQFIISTCEDRLFTLMQKKFARLNGRAIFYEFLGMSDNGPIVERR